MVEILSLLWLTVCAAWDHRQGRVPNALTLPALGLGGILAWRRGEVDLILFGVVMLVCLLMFWRDALGGADAKILAALGGLWPAGALGALLGAALWVAAGTRLQGSQRCRAVPGMWLGAAGIWGLTALDSAPILIAAESVGGFRLVV